ncbi:MAG: DsbA family protein [Rhodocyclaceae bacterium]|nr:DsbA family protein [Rhodocyclaceae bacterium]
MRRLNWYFDFISPFAYLASQRLHVLVPPDVDLRLVPVLFAGLLDHFGHKGPAELPAKRRFTYRHVVWQAERAGIPLKFPPGHPFNPLAVLRLALALDCRPEVVDRIFCYIWLEGKDPNQPDNWEELALSLGFASAEAAREAANAAAVKAALAANGAEAVAAGVFGVPTLALDGELYWGWDAMEFALAALADPARYAGGEYARVADLPEATQRKAVR